MKIKNRISLVLLLFLSIAVLYGCNMVNAEQKSIYNDNAKIAQEGDSFSYATRSENGSSENKSTLKTSIKFGGFYGSDTIWIINSDKSDEITLNFHSSIKKGSFKAVLVNPNKEIESVFSGSKDGKININLEKGKYMLKIVGLDAKGQINLTINKNQDLAIEKVNH